MNKYEICIKNITEARKFKTLKKLICVLTFKKHKITEFIDFVQQ